VDEIFKIHLHLDAVLHGDKNWKWLYIGSFTGLMVWQYRNFVMLWQQYHRETLLAFIGILIFILGGYGSEIFRDILLAQSPDGAIAYAHLLGVSVEQWRIAYEELSELLGENLILYACLQFISKH
jgi:hypothetical protein